MKYIICLFVGYIIGINLHYSSPWAEGYQTCQKDLAKEVEKTKKKYVPKLPKIEKREDAETEVPAEEEFDREVNHNEQIDQCINLYSLGYYHAITNQGPTYSNDAIEYILENRNSDKSQVDDNKELENE